MKYFGPYGHAWAIRETVDLLLRVFPMRSCSNGVFKRSAQIGRPCLLGYIEKCSAPCVGRVDADEHRPIAEDFADFMGGRTDSFVKRIQREMYAASEAQDYERAARLRDDLGALNKALEKQAVVFGDGTDADVIALAEDPLEVAVQIFHVRAGRIRVSAAGWPTGSRTSTPPAWSSEFLLQLYAGEEADGIPREILVPALPEDADTFEQLLGETRGSKVAIRVPQRGDKRTLQETVAKNAAQSLALHKTKRASDLTVRNQALEEIQEALDLPSAPLRIECYDVSNLQGTEVVASMVVFEDGLARKSEYRRFVIRGVDGQNDVASMHEVITRRFRRLIDERIESPDLTGGEIDPASGPMLVDPETGRPAQVRLRPRPRRGRRRSAPGRGSPAGPRRARHRRHPALRSGQAARGGLGARRGRPRDPAALERGPLPAPAHPRRGAPLRDHPPPLPAVQDDGGEPARRRPRAGRGPAQDPDQALRVPEEAPGCDDRGDRGGPGHRHPDGDGDLGGRGRRRRGRPLSTRRPARSRNTDGHAWASSSW